MTNLPFPVLITVNLPSGVGIGANITVRQRNETTGNSTTALTNSDSLVILNAANITSGYITTDTISYEVIYDTYEGSTSLLISGGPSQTITITLVSTTASSSVNYTTVQNVWDELGGKTSSDVSALKVIRAIQQAERIIDQRSGMRWVSTTATDEIYDWNDITSWQDPEQTAFQGTSSRRDYGRMSRYNNRFQLRHYPVISITSLSTNSASITSTESWTVLTEQTGSGGDFVLDNDKLGMLSFVDNGPRYGKRSIKTTYAYGSVDSDGNTYKDIERLATLLASRYIMFTKMNEDVFDNVESITVDVVSVHGGSTNILKLNAMNAEIQELWAVVGEFKSAVTGTGPY